ncbi:zinc finger protein 836-like [Drosophila montana]|uniref:zinc finger protein 836-like n=1 Tax=Drosophila montana TaxID=40370 RepID=UPI00313AFF3D
MIRSRGIHRKKCLRFKNEDKSRLIAAVRVRRLLWDLKDSEHNDLISIKAAWQSVGAEMRRDPQECKVAWRSLRQSYRYHCKTAYTRIKIDGEDNEGETDPLETPDIQWEFADDMAFLQDLTRKRNPSSDSIQLDDTTTTNTELDDYTEYTDAEYLDSAYEIHNGDDNDEADIDDNNDDVEDDANVVSLTSELAYKRIHPKSPRQDVCRTCAQTIDHRTAKNLFKPENHQLLCQIKALTDLILKQDEEFSDLICGHCQQSLEIASKFRRVCIESQTQALIKVQVKDEEIEQEIMSCSESNMPHSPSNSDLLIEEERLEEIDISDDEKYYEAVDVQPLVSTPSPPSPSAKKKIKKEPRNHKYQCHQCGLTFTSQDLLKMHMHQCHDMQLHTRFVCKHCGHDFKYSAPLVEHLKSIGVYFGYKCEECGQKFHSRHFLKKHKRRVHGQADQHICHMCGKNFTTGFNLRNHIVRHSGTRPHKCKLCSAAFSTTAELNNHQRTHDNVRPYPCRYACGKSFRHCSNRSTHERVHMAGSLRPFQCDYCEKTFVTKGDCRSHQMVHTMSRDFSCDICEQSFKLQKHYLQHLTTKSHKKVEDHIKALKQTESVA